MSANQATPVAAYEQAIKTATPETIGKVLALRERAQPEEDSTNIDALYKKLKTLDDELITKVAGPSFSYEQVRDKLADSPALQFQALQAKDSARYDLENPPKTPATPLGPDRYDWAQAVKDEEMMNGKTEAPKTASEKPKPQNPLAQYTTQVANYTPQDLGHNTKALADGHGSNPTSVAAAPGTNLGTRSV